MLFLLTQFFLFNFSLHDTLPLTHLPHTHSLSLTHTYPTPQGLPLKKALATVSKLGLISALETVTMQGLVEKVRGLKETLQVRYGAVQ